MCNVICVTNRSLCGGSFLRRLEEIAAAGVSAVILREKDMTSEQYRLLAARSMEVCRRRRVPCILHNFPGTALELGAKALHLPMPKLRALGEEERKQFDVLGASCHTLAEAREAEALGCTYITAGHIFATDCKRGLAPRGTDFLREVSRAVEIPVYAIGGIHAANVGEVMQTGAAGVCVMSGLTRCADVAQYIDGLRRNMSC